jgi:hypothetical protein
MGQNIYDEALLLHEQHRGKIEVRGKVQVKNRHDLSVAEVARKIATDHAIAAYISHPTKEYILPSVIDRGVGWVVAAAVAEAWTLFCTRESFI